MRKENRAVSEKPSILENENSGFISGPGLVPLWSPHLPSSLNYWGPLTMPDRAGERLNTERKRRGLDLLRAPLALEKKACSRRPHPSSLRPFCPFILVLIPFALWWGKWCVRKIAKAETTNRLPCERLQGIVPAGLRAAADRVTTVFKMLTQG